MLKSRTQEDSIAENRFRGLVVDMAPARLGAELTIDIGVKVTALVASESLERLGVDCGEEVWVSLKATAAQYIDK